MFGTRIERLHVVKRLCVALLVKYLSLCRDSLTRGLFKIAIIGIKLDHFFLRCVSHYIRDKIATLN